MKMIFYCLFKLFFVVVVVVFAAVFVGGGRGIGGRGGGGGVGGHRSVLRIRIPEHSAANYVVT